MTPLKRRFMNSIFALGLCAFALQFFTPGCGLLPKKLTVQDCQQWSNQFTKITKQAFVSSLESCVTRSNATNIDKSAILKKADENIEKQRALLEKACGAQAGKSYIARDAECYMHASKLQDWSSCAFQTPFFLDFAKMASSFDREFEKECDTISKASKAMQATSASPSTSVQK